MRAGVVAVDVFFEIGGVIGHKIFGGGKKGVGIGFGAGGGGLYFLVGYLGREIDRFFDEAGLG
jgi:hypothetical protein